MQRSRTALRSLTRQLSTSAARPAPAAYAAPLKPGQLPAFDEAVAYIAKDRENKLKQLEELKRQGGVDQAVLDKLEVEAWANDPETRWKAKNGQADLSKPVYRQLVKRAWHKDGDLTILLQRIHQMHIVPDLLPSLSPEVDVRIQVAGETVEPGAYTQPAQTREGFEVSAQVFHPEERLYTLLVIDPDVPDELNQSFTTFAHLLIPNITVSATTPASLPLSTLPSTLPFVPPHPQNGTPYHRYTVLLLEQPSQLSLDAADSALERGGFSAREFVQQHGLEARGVSFFRQVWDREVSKIYEEVLNLPEPRYGRPPKIDTYTGRPPKYEVV
ncbi:hypothetical protein JCM10207_004208 [Rhodosporidiobolus poonsookiae]